ncbi:cytochrome P450 71A1 [Selaginella moellendorffii]|nr:cytochrome P450 71A1 [Selaginella moellendorffii]|eukprot:XP_002986721.2 cytochrome P450 71A1 [Selaginella moellendorffii]
MASFVALFLLTLSFGLLWRILTKIVDRSLPPGPPRVPLLGHLHLLGVLPHKSLSDLSRRYGPVMLLWFGFAPTLVVSSPDAAREVLCTQDLAFASRPKISVAKYVFYNSKDLGWTTYGPYWRLMRKVTTVELFTAKRLEESRMVRHTQVSKLIDFIVNNGQNGKASINMKVLLSILNLNVVSSITFGREFHAGSVEVIEEVMRLMGSFVLGDCFPFLSWLGSPVIRKMISAHTKLDQLLQEIVDEHKSKFKSSERAGDFVDVLLSLEDQGEIDVQCVKAMIMDMILAGTETSAITTEWALSELMNSPTCMIKAQKEIDTIVGRERMVVEADLCKLSYIHNVVNEVFRLHPPAPLLLPHHSTQDCLVNGYKIPKNSRVLVNVWSIARDPSLWESPNLFKPDRFAESSISFKGKNFELLPFGSGRRICPGLSLGVAMVSYTLARLVHGFEWKVSGKELSMDEISEGVAVRRKVPLEVFATPRLASHAYL